MTICSPNYDYILETANKLGKGDKPRILDFGCGRGQTVERGVKLGMDVWGADTFTADYANWREELPATISAKVQKIENGIIDYPDDHFDVVTSNQVFEHIDELAPVLTEINRVLKPGGVLLALFPIKSTWFEGHVGLYFAHWLDFSPRLQWQYMHLMHKFGFGYYRNEENASEWTTHSQKTLRETCFYHSGASIQCQWKDVFGEKSHSYEADYMRFRFSRHPRLKVVSQQVRSPVLSPLLKLVCLVRAGRVYVVRSRQI